MEIWEEGKALAESIKDWTERSGVYFNVNHSRNNEELGELWKVLAFLLT